MSFTNINDFEKLTLKEIQDKIITLKIEILELKIKKATRQNIKSHLFKHKKHQVSQLLTLKTKKQS